MSTTIRASALALLILPGLAGSAVAQTDEPRLQVFGHLSQATAASVDAPIMGIPDGLTADYRSAALQARFLMTPSSNVVVQVSNRRLGMSPLVDDDHDLILDWAFYQHRLGPLRLRAGRVPITMGIYNEVRDVGTLLPFYRAPGNFYLEGTEAVDGVTLGYTAYRGDWSFEAHAFGGATGYREAFHTPEGPVVVDVHWEGTVGAQVWLGTPLQGLRVGGGAISLKPDDELPEEFRDRMSVWQVSVDGDFERYMVRGEYQVFSSAWLKTEGFYVQGGLDLVGPLRLVAQAEVMETKTLTPFEGPWMRWSEDYALGLNHRVSPHLVLKLEAHRAKGYDFETFVDPSGPPLDTTYGIASIAVSF